MHIDQFDYDLPERLIAQQPPPERDLSRLMVASRDGSPPTDHVFRDLPSLLDPGDLLVLNDTRVLPARLVGRRARSGGKWEGLFLREEPGGAWELLTQTRGRLLMGETILVDPETPSTGDAPLPLRLEGKAASGRWLAKPESAGPAAELLARYGRTPLPPYIRKGRAAPGDRERYQTVYARQAGAVAAPTAGLHFTPRLFDALKERGIERTFVTLHVGAGTFQPVTAEDVTQHRVQPEWGEVPAAAAEAVAACKAPGRRVVSVGTTSVRMSGNGGAGGRAVAAVVRLDRPDDPAAIHVPSGGRAGDEFPPAAVELAAAGRGVRGPGEDEGGVPAGRGAGVSVLFLWGCDADSVNPGQSR